MQRRLHRTFSPGQIALHLVMIGFMLAALVPFLLMIMSSFTDEDILLKYGYTLFPSKFSLYAYYYLFVADAVTILRSYAVTLGVTASGTMLSLLLTPMMGYALSRKDYRKRGVLTFYIFFTMLFNGGLVPQYLMYTQILHIKNTFAALIVPNLLISAFSILLMKSYFVLNIHPALIEAAKMDGGGEFYIFFRIVMPLSTPILATMGLMTGIGYWNDWMNGLYYISNAKFFSLQVLLNRILANLSFLRQYGNELGFNIPLPSTAIRMAMATIGSVPILVLYPFFQKYFVKGISLGGVKG